MGKTFSLLILLVLGIFIGFIVASAKPLISFVLVVCLLMFSIIFFSPLWSLVLLLCLTPLQILWKAGGISPIELFYSCAFILTFIVWIFKRLRDNIFDKPAGTTFSPMFLPLLSLLAVTAICSFIAIADKRPFTHWASDLNFMIFYAAYFIVATEVKEKKQLKNIFLLLLFVTIFGIVRKIILNLVDSQHSIIMTLWGKPVLKIVGAGGFGMIFFLILCALVCYMKSSLERKQFIFIILILGLHQILEAVRSRWLGCLAGVLFLYIVIPSEKKKKFTKVGVFIIFIVIIYLSICFAFPSENIWLKLPFMLQQRFGSIFNISVHQKEPPIISRYSEWQNALSKAIKHPILGNGLGTEITYTTYDRKIPVSVKTRFIHNSYIYFFLNMGMVGLAVFLWMALKFIFYSIKVSRSIKDEVLQGLAIGFAASFVGMMVTSLAGPQITHPSFTIWIGFLMGGVVAIDRFAEKR